MRITTAKITPRARSLHASPSSLSFSSAWLGKQEEARPRRLRAGDGRCRLRGCAPLPRHGGADGRSSRAPACPRPLKSGLSADTARRDLRSQACQRLDNGTLISFGLSPLLAPGFSDDSLSKGTRPKLLAPPPRFSFTRGARGREQQ